MWWRFRNARPQPAHVHGSDRTARVRSARPLPEATSLAGTVAGDHQARRVPLHRPTFPDTPSTEIDAANPAHLADRLLRDVGTRLAHSARVATQADRVAHLLNEPWRSAIAEAAWLHDIGYSEQIARTDFHPLDGARWLRDHGWPSEVCRLVAWHTEASIEAALRGLDCDLVAEFEQPPSSVAAVLSWADMTSSPAGEACTVDRRIDDILGRYPAGSAVHTATTSARPALCAAVADIEALLARPPIAA